MSERIPCINCGAMILPSTAQVTGGLCMPCSKVKTPKEKRKKKLKYASLEESLAAVDHYIKDNELDVGSLAGATDSDIRFLKDTINSKAPGQFIPEELFVWFRWHNGQNGHDAIHPDDVRTLLSIEDAIKEWNFFNDESSDFLEPFEQFWFPLLGNGAGDFLCLVMSGANQGALIEYWHADSDRNIVFESLIHWASDITE